MTRILLLLFAALTCVAATQAAEPSEEYYSLVDKADKAIKDGEWSNAEAIILEAMRLEPANPSNILLMSNLGMTQFYAGRDSVALSTLNAAHAMAPASVTVLQNRARVLTEMSRTHEALRDYSHALSLDSTLVESRFYRAMLSLQEGDTSTVESDLKILKRISPDTRLTLLAEATYQSMTGHLREAITAYTKLIAQDSEARFLSARAACYLGTGQLAEASEDIRLTLEKDPTDGETYLYRAILNKMRYRQKDAEEDGMRAIQLGIPAERVKALIR